MDIQKVINENITIIKPEGWLDTITSPEFSEYIKNLAPSQELVLDFEQIEYISSAGVRAVVAAYKSQRDNHAAFRVINVSSEIMEVFLMTGLNRKISISEK